MSNRIDPSMYPVKAAGVESSQDPVLAHSGAKQLAGPDDTVLSSGNFRNYKVRLGVFLSHTES